MDKWEGKIALVTGSSGGIGADLAVALANSGMIVIGLARRVDAVQVWFFFTIFFLIAPRISTLAKKTYLILFWN